MELSSSFIEELLKASINSKNVLDVLRKHMGFQHLPNEAYKAIWKEINVFYNLENKLPTIGILNQSVNGIKDVKLKQECKHILSSIKDLQVSDVNQQLLDKFEEFKKKLDFKIAFNKTHDIFQNEDEDKAIEYMAKKSSEILSFSIKDGFYDTVFKDFEKRNALRRLKERDLNEDRIPTGIHELDYYIRGGFKKGTSFLGLGRSGSGKSTFLRWLAVHAARQGYKVVLFSLEDTKEGVMEALDACWTSTPLQEIEFGEIEESKLNKVKQTISKIMMNGGEIYVYSAESFDTMTIEEARRIIKEIIKIYGPIDMALFDYLELFGVESNKFIGEAGERRRRETIANKITDIAIEEKIVTGSVSQASDISPNLYNDSSFVLTRHHTSEFKGLVKPFSYMITFNQTDDEYENGVCRLYCDKFRKHRSGQTIGIAQSMEINRFYNSLKTLRMFWDNETHKKKVNV